ncbi:hypothetical protein CPC08DRAFT_780981 [Agrocybe pediades]|nr:hypothetical protein CPC08DRAFT_780981 [Agrocybe pediades]
MVRNVRRNQLGLALDNFSKLADATPLYCQQKVEDTLPALETTAAIFQFLCRSDDSADHIEVLSHVCHSWRALALSRAEYWEDFFSTGETNSQVDRLHVYLERSKDRPFNFAVRVGQRYPVIIEKLLEVAVEHIHRLRHLSVVSEDYTWTGTEFIKKLHAMSAPRLELIQISINDITNGADHVRQTKFLGGQADNLTTLYLDATWIADASWLQKFSNIKTIQIHTNSGLTSVLAPRLPTETLTRLFQCPNLESLSAVGLRFENFVNFPIIKTKAAKLKNLRCSDGSMLEFILRSVDAPKLELFIVQRLTFHDGIRIPSPDDLEQPLFPSLHTVALTDCSIMPDYPSSGTEVVLTFTKATNNAKHVYLTSCHQSNMEEWLFYEMVEEFKRKNIIVYPNMEQLYCAFTRAPFGGGASYTDYTTILKSRTDSLKKHCTLHLYDHEVESWKIGDPESWKVMEDGDYYRRIDPEYPDGVDLVPWPPRAAQLERDGWMSYGEHLSLCEEPDDDLEQE